MLKLLLAPNLLMVGKLVGFLLNGLMLIGTIGTILLIAWIANKRITKKEQEKEQGKKD